MILAVILGINLLHGVGTPIAPSSVLRPAIGAQASPSTTSSSQDSGPSSPVQASTSQSKTSTEPQTAPAAGAQGQSSATAPKAAKVRRHHKPKAPDCLDAEAVSKQAGANSSPDATAAKTALPPCPPKKTVIRNGGTSEPTLQLTGTDPAQKASRDATAQLQATTEENLKKLAGRDLKPDQRQTLDQVREFLEQSKKAIAAGDLERGQNLASKARVLSDEMVKP